MILRGSSPLQLPLYYVDTWRFTAYCGTTEEAYLASMAIPSLRRLVLVTRHLQETFEEVVLSCLHHHWLNENLGRTTRNGSFSGYQRF
jgi:hypothetical protein